MECPHTVGVKRQHFSAQPSTIYKIDRRRDGSIGEDLAWVGVDTDSTEKQLRISLCVHHPIDRASRRRRLSRSDCAYSHMPVKTPLLEIQGERTSYL